MKVKELIEFLQTQNPDLDVAYQLFSEQCLLEVKDIQVVELSVPRPDGWVAYKRPNIDTQYYLVFPGN